MTQRHLGGLWEKTDERRDRTALVLDPSAQSFDTRAMSTVHLVGGEKGGVGKSVVARALAQYFVDRQLAFVAVDADTSHGALRRYYADFTQAVDLESFPSADQIMDRALAADRRVLVDLPAQSARLLKRWLDAGEVVNFAREMDVSLVLWHVSDGGFDSVNELQRAVETFGDSVNYVVVRNFGRSPEFSQLDKSPTLTALYAAGGRVMELPALDGETMYKIDSLGTSFWAAINSLGGEPGLSAMERRRAKRWLEQVYAAFDDIQLVL